MDLPDGVTAEMVEALKRGQDVRMPDGSPVRMYRPFAGEQYGEWSVVIVREQVGLPTIRLSPDYNAPSPLWPSSDETDAMVPKELLDRLIGWQQEFDSKFPLGNGLALGRSPTPMGRPGGGARSRCKACARRKGGPDGRFVAAGNEVTNCP